MNIKSIIKDNLKAILIILAISMISGIILRKSVGIKDAGMFSMATAFLLFEIYYSFVDIKKSILLFIISFPILVTARKICYFDFLFFKFTYEAIYIQFIFIANFKMILAYLKRVLIYKNSLNAKFIVLSIIFIIFAFNSSIFSKNIIKSVGAAYLGVLIPIMFMLIIVAIFKKNEIDKIIYSLILSIDLSCLYGFFQIFKNHISFNMIESRRYLITFGYHNINIFAGILITVFPILSEKILYNKKNKKENIFLYVSLAIYLSALFITYSRGAWISSIFAVFIILISKKYKKFVYVFTALILLGARWIIPFILHRGRVHVMFFSNESMVARVQSIFTSAAILFKNPFGIGGGNFASAYNEYALKGYLIMPKDYRIRIPIANYPLEMAHNLVLQIAVEFGLVCVIVFLIIIINRVVAIFKNYRLNRGIFTSIMVWAIFSITTGTEFNHKGVITGTLIMWLIFGLVSLNVKEGNSYEKDY